MRDSDFDSLHCSSEADHQRGSGRSGKIKFEGSQVYDERYVKVKSAGKLDQ